MSNKPIQIEIDKLGSRYSTVAFSGAKTTRDGRKNLGSMKLTAETAFELGCNNIGVFVQNCPCMELLVEQFSELSERQESQWVVVASSKAVAAELSRLWDEAVDTWRKPNVFISTPEQLEEVSNAINRDKIAAVFVVDYACHVHKARGFKSRGIAVQNDRPQKIADFRSSLATDSWCPPIFFFTNKRAISVNVTPMLSPYCLEAFRYINGRAMRIGQQKQQPLNVCL